jgi:hypothetical protein
MVKPLQCAAAVILKLYVRPGHKVFQRAGYEYPIWCRCRDHPSRNVDSYAIHVVCASFYLADMQPSAHAETYSGHNFDNRGCTTQRPRWTIERNEKTVAQRLDLTTAEPSNLSPGKLIVTGQQCLPCTVTELTRALRRVDDIGKQNGCQHAICRNRWPRASQELLNLVVQTIGVADQRVVISGQLDILGIWKMTREAATGLYIRSAIAYPMQEQARRPH